MINVSAPLCRSTKRADPPKLSRRRDRAAHRFERPEATRCIGWSKRMSWRRRLAMVLLWLHKVKLQILAAGQLDVNYARSLRMEDGTEDGEPLSRGVFQNSKPNIRNPKSQIPNPEQAYVDCAFPKRLLNYPLCRRDEPILVEIKARDRSRIGDSARISERRDRSRGAVAGKMG